MPINKNKDYALTVYIPKEIAKELKKEAEKRQRSMSQIGRFAIEYYLNGKKKGKE